MAPSPGDVAWHTCLMTLCSHFSCVSRGCWATSLPPRDPDPWVLSSQRAPHSASLGQSFQCSVNVFCSQEPFLGPRRRCRWVSPSCYGLKHSPHTPGLPVGL